MDPIIPLNIGGAVYTYHYLATGSAATAAQLSDVSVTVYRPCGSELISNQTVSLDSDGKMKIAISDTQASQLGDYYRARFRYTAESTSHVKDIYFHISKTGFDLPVHYAELLRLEPDLASMSYSGDEKFEQFRLAARDELFYRLKATGRRPWALLNINDLQPCALYLWASYVFRALSKSHSDYFPRAQHYRDLFEHIFSRSDFLEDLDGDAAPDEQTSPLQQTNLKRS